MKPGDPTVVLLNPQSGEYYTLNAVGSRVWQLCDGKSTATEIVAIIVQEFEAPAEVIESDVFDLLKDLFDEALLIRLP